MQRLPWGPEAEDELVQENWEQILGEWVAVEGVVREQVGMVEYVEAAAGAPLLHFLPPPPAHPPQPGFDTVPPRHLKHNNHPH